MQQEVTLYGGPKDRQVMVVDDTVNHLTIMGVSNPNEIYSPDKTATAEDFVVTKKGTYARVIIPRNRFVWVGWI